MADNRSEFISFLTVCGKRLDFLILINHNIINIINNKLNYFLLEYLSLYVVFTGVVAYKCITPLVAPYLYYTI